MVADPLRRRSHRRGSAGRALVAAAANTTSPKAVAADTAMRSSPEAAAPAPAPNGPTRSAEEDKKSYALVKVTEQNTITTASLIPGLVGFWFGGMWVAGALFAAGAYYARQKDDDVGQGLRNIGQGTLEAINFLAELNDEYDISGKVSGAFMSAVEAGKKDKSTKERLDQLSNTINAVTEAAAEFDKTVGVKDTVGNLLTTASDVAGAGVNTAVELNDEYEVTNKLSNEVLSKIRSR
eukprot:TRINITY_DN13872_c0_g1_i3.p1 TRINITY_DN13872_c0_g1~~TRINITY_DN13872_c0_g1_i3.p1  ORF type:complete len:270 (-),score=52.65 TRINITY_DN13872_c0_g1_i3:114-824(-)